MKRLLAQPLGKISIVLADHSLQAIPGNDRDFHRRHHSSIQKNKNSKKQDDSDYVCVNSNDCMSSDNLCVSNSMNGVKFRANLSSINLRKLFGKLNSEKGPPPNVDLHAPEVITLFLIAMQEELHKFERLEVWELVPSPDKAFVISLKWIYKVKLDELGVDTSMVEKSLTRLRDKEGTSVHHHNYRWFMIGAVPFGVFGIGKDSSFALTAFADGGSCGCHRFRRCTFGSIQLLGDRLVSWSLKTEKGCDIQDEAEFIALSGCFADSDVSKPARGKERCILDSVLSLLLRKRHLVISQYASFESPGGSNIRVNSFTMKMEILLEPTSNKLMVVTHRLSLLSCYLALRRSADNGEHAEYDESNTYVLERFNTTAGNPVKKILLKLNLSDHRSILTDLKSKISKKFPSLYTESSFLESENVLKLKNFKKDETFLKLFKSNKFKVKVLSMSVQKCTTSTRWQNLKMAKGVYAWLMISSVLKIQCQIQVQGTSSILSNDHYNIFTMRKKSGVRAKD
ncbi:hypothetical protein Tco_0291670 [Tanacetum coccineum]